MKLIFAAITACMIPSLATAGSISLRSGEVVSITANSDTTVRCDGSLTQPEPRFLEFSFCECKSMNLNGVNLTQAVLKLKYSDASYPSETVLREFSNGFGDNGEANCGAFLRTVARCSQ